MICPDCGLRWADPDSPCPFCAELAASRRKLSPAMRDLTSRVRSIPPPDQLAGALAEFDSVQRARRGRTSRRWMATVGGALAASLLAGAILLRHQPALQDRAAVSAPAAETVSFLPIPYTQPIQPYERIMVVQTYVPVRELIAAGFEVRTSDPGASVPADVMVSQDGRPRAIRPVSFVMSPRRNP